MDHRTALFPQLLLVHVWFFNEIVRNIDSYCIQRKWKFPISVVINLFFLSLLILNAFLGEWCFWAAMVNWLKTQNQRNSRLLTGVCGGVLHTRSVMSNSLWPQDTVACQALLFMKFSRQEYWSGLPFPTAGDLPKSGTEPESLGSPALTGRFFTTSAAWESPTRGRDPKSA